MAAIKRRKTKTEVKAKKIEKASARKVKVKKNDERVAFINSGCDALNHALSGSTAGGWARGRIINIVGDGSTGKTLLVLELAAHFLYYIKTYVTKLFPKVKTVKVIYNNGENVMDIDIGLMYDRPKGKSFEKLIDWRSSPTAEHFGRDVGREIKKTKSGTAVLYIIDSLDSLKSAASQKRFIKAMKEDKDEDGAYKGAEKAGYFSQSFFNNICEMMAGKDFTLCIVSQTRKAIGVKFGEKQYRTGGSGLDFYTHQVLWLRKVKALARKIKGEHVTYGIHCEGKVKRSKVSKPFRIAPFHVIYDRGLDNLRSTAEKLFKKNKPYWKVKGKKKNFRSEEDFILYVEKNNLEDEFREKLAKFLDGIENELVKPLKKRKPRFE